METLSNEIYKISHLEGIKVCTYSLTKYYLVSTLTMHKNTVKRSRNWAFPLACLWPMEPSRTFT